MPMRGRPQQIHEPAASAGSTPPGMGVVLSTSVPSTSRGRPWNRIRAGPQLHGR